MTDKIINIVIECPNCNECVLIEQLNCRIFRHGIMKHNGTQINPHSSKDLCDHYVKNDMICYVIDYVLKQYSIITPNNTING